MGTSSREGKKPNTMILIHGLGKEKTSNKALEEDGRTKEKEMSQTGGPKRKTSTIHLIRENQDGCKNAVNKQSSKNSSNDHLRDESWLRSRETVLN